ncbi:uncharacterized protein [Amphiura filiformis]|uniref:uncharacterized protein n=1 Tax=Amphiura filiformis TaxID=82378 RepID=UPI003B212ECC
MLVFHKEKYVSSCKPAKKRRRDDDSDTSSDDADSEDSDWAPSNTRTKRSSRVTRASKKPPANGDNASGGKVKGRNASGGSMTEAGSDTSGMNNEATQGSSVASSGTAQSTTQHHDEDHDEHDDCLACKQAKLKANPPPVRIKQEPLDPSEVSNMPVISNVFSMTPTTNTEPLTNGFDDSKSTTSTTVLYNGNDDHDRPASVGSDYSTATEKGNTGFNVMSGSSPSTGWQPLAAMPSSGANVQADNMCTSCLAQKPNQNKCEHCGSSFLSPPCI